MPGWKPKSDLVGVVPHDKRRHFRDINATHDILGAQADSSKPFIQTTRQTNPLNPHYVSLDGYDLQVSPPVTPAYDVNPPHGGLGPDSTASRQEMGNAASTRREGRPVDELSIREKNAEVRSSNHAS